MIAALVFVNKGEKKADQMWMAGIFAAESLQNLDFLFVFVPVLAVELLDGEVLILGPLSGGLERLVSGLIA